MAVEKIEQTGDEKREEGKEVQGKTDSMMDDIIKTLDLPEEAEDEKEEEVVEDEEEEEEDVEDTEDEEESEGETKDDDLIPRSKLEKIQKKTERRIAQQSRRIRELESKLETKSDTGDKDLERLRTMSENELKVLKRQVRREQIKTDDDERLEQLLDLEDKIDSTISEAPNRLMKTQVARYDMKAEEIEELEGELDEDTIKFLKGKAAQIYQRNKIFQKSPDGQALALELAYEHYTELKKASKGKPMNRDLKRKMNTLKRKTALDTSSQKNKSEISASLKKLRQKAFRGGDTYDKEKLVENDPRFNIDALIPEEFKEK